MAKPIPHGTITVMRRRSSLGAAAAGVLVAAACALLLPACDEALPPRNEPVSPLAITCTLEYYQTRSEEWVYFTVKIRNNYTEVFSDVTNVYGYLDFAWAADPALRKHVLFSEADLKTAYFNPLTGQMLYSRATYNASNRMLTIPVGEAAVFQYRWDSKFDGFTADSLNDIRDMLLFTRDPANAGILNSADVRLVVSGGIRLYKRLPMLYLEPVIAKFRYRRTAP